MQSEDGPTTSEIQCLLQGTISGLTRHEKEQHEGHLTRLQCALDNYALIEPPALSHHTSPSTPKSSESYLARLPERVLNCVIRHLSEQPRDPVWEQFIDTKVAEDLYCGRDAVSQHFRKLFRCVIVSETGLCRKGRGKFRKKKYLSQQAFLPRDPTQVWMSLRTREWPSEALQVLAHAGETVERLRCWAGSGSNPPPHRTGWIVPFREHCVSVRHLEISGPSETFLELVLSHRPGQLESLALGYSSSACGHLESVATHCAGLRRFSLSSVRSDETRVWKVLGPTLEDLTVSFVRDKVREGEFSSVIRAMQDECRALRRITVNDHGRSATDQVERWLRSYGLQLEYAFCSFSAMGSDACLRIADACPYATFGFKALTRAGTVQDLRFRVKSLCIEKYKDEGLEEEAFCIGSNCRSLTRLVMKNVGNVGENVLSGILHFAKPWLSFVHLNLNKDFSEQVFRQLALSTTKIKTLVMTVQSLNLGGIKQVLVANQVLSYVRVYAGEKVESISVGSVLELIQYCIEAGPSLQQLVLSRRRAKSGSGDVFKFSDIQVIADACVPLRLRKMQVHVLGKDFV